MKPLGQILLESSNIAEEDINYALEIQRERGGLLGKILVQEKNSLNLNFYTHSVFIPALNCEIRFLQT